MADVDWSKFESKASEDRFKPEKGKTYPIGFVKDSLESGEFKVFKPNPDPNAEKIVDKIVPQLKLKLETVSGQPSTQIFSVTSKKCVELIKKYYEKKDERGERMLYNWIFDYQVVGDGLQTKHSLIPSEPKKRAGPKVIENKIEAFV